MAENDLKRIDTGEDRPGTLETARREIPSEPYQRPADVYERMKAGVRGMYDRLTGGSTDSNRGRRDSRR